jgi:hypothetical protein
MEETWARNAPNSFETWHYRVSGQQSENNVCIHYKFIICLGFILCKYSVWMCNCCISSRRINHRGALLHALILCPHANDKLSCVPNSNLNIKYMLCMFAQLCLTLLCLSSKRNVSNPHSVGVVSSHRDGGGVSPAVEMQYIYKENFMKW